MPKTFQRILLDVSTTAELDSGDIRSACRVLLRAAMQGLDISRAGIWLWNASHDELDCFELIDLRYPQASPHISLSRTEFPDYFAALDSERVISAVHAETYPATAAFTSGYLQPLAIKSLLDVPLHYQGIMHGVMCCESVDTVRNWTDAQINFASTLADLYGRAKSAERSLQYLAELELNKLQLEDTVRARTQQLQENLQQLQDTQAQLVESEKMAALGNLVAGVAHEINNPLGVAITALSAHQQSVQELQRKFSSGALSRQAMDKFFTYSDDAVNAVMRNLDRAATLVRNFKKTAVDQSVFDEERIDFGEYLETVLSNLRPLCKKYGVEIEVNCPADVIIRTYPGAFAQILSNLVMNACLHGFTSRESNNRISIVVTEAAQQITLSLTDNGAGMTEEVLKKALQPFYTTRRHLGGSGLGLPIVYNLVTQKLKGKLRLSSVPGSGTTVTMSFPQFPD